MTVTNSVYRASLMLVCLIAVALAASTASATLVFVDGTGAPAAAPAVLDPSNEAIYFTESLTPRGGEYAVVNNTQGYGLTAFGISNPGSFAYIGSPGSTFGCFMAWCYESLELDASNWATEELDFYGNTGADLFGSFPSVLDPGDTMINFYRAVDGDLQPGDSWDGFLFGEEVLLSSQMFVVLEGSGGPLYATGGAPVPEPGTALLLIGGLMGLSARRRA